MHCIKTDFRDHWKYLYMKQRNWGYGKSNNINNIPEFMSLELNVSIQLFILLSINPYINPVIQRSKATCYLVKKLASRNKISIKKGIRSVGRKARRIAICFLLMFWVWGGTKPFNDWEISIGQ